MAFSGTQWINDRNEELADKETDTGETEIHFLTEFPPSDTRSFYCRDSADADSKVPEAARPAFGLRDGNQSTWRRISDIHAQPKLFPVDDKTHYGRV